MSRYYKFPVLPSKIVVCFTHILLLNLKKYTMVLTYGHCMICNFYFSTIQSKMYTVTYCGSEDNSMMDRSLMGFLDNNYRLLCTSQPFTYRLCFLCSIPAGLVTLGTSQVEVDQLVNVNRGQEVTLRCVYTGTHIPGSITWWKVNGDSLMRIAIALPSSYRILNNTDFYGRLNFTNLTSELRNGSIRIEDLRFGDEGDFTCSFATLDVETQATISLTVNAPPNVSLELNPSQLIDGMGLVTVATCVAQEGKPAASITWSGLHQGSSSETTEVVPDGTVTVKSRYQMEPKYESHGRTLTCRVEHPAFEFPVNLSTTLDIHFPPNVSLELNPSQLVDGMGLVTVATCVAQEGQPAASITWSGLHQGSSTETTEMETDGKVTVRSEYRMEPTKESQGRTLTCRVEHPALKPPLVELSTTLDIHCEWWA
uniref:Nectin-3-like isoform X2 n=1 Tax=Petromyzon marinus TaxID=7757 RepID=A0AAJ7UB47_PETMA|nr:nectin-3-like isoform X2 [Petromyzon marinus]